MNALRAVLTLSCLAMISDAQDPLPEGPGKNTVATVCASCHDLDTAIEVKHDRAGWKTVVDTMADRGARATDAEFQIIIDYLTKYFGAVEAPAAPATKASNAPAARVSTAAGNTAVAPVSPEAEWPVYGHDVTGQRYSALKQIDTRNVSKLKLAWQYGGDPGSVDLNPATRAITSTEAVPIMVGGVLYTPTIHHSIVALEPETGKEIWKYDLGKPGAPLRGVTYWAGDKDNPPQVLAGLSDGSLIALNAKTGRLVPGFGSEGRLDLRPGVADKFPSMPYHMSSPGVIYKNLIITGAQGQEENPDGPAMDVRGWDLRTGKLAWTFHTIPHPGEPGFNTWPENNWVSAGSPANWGAATVDAERGLIFLPVGQPASQYYGGARPGQNLYSSSIVALDANTGKIRWHFQLTHHDMWDYDAEAAPTLMDVVRDGKKIPVVVAVSKPGLMFFLDRETGKSIYPVEERAVPQSDVPGEQSWPTQPFPLKPPPLARLGMKPDEIFTGEPEHEKFCRDLVEKIGGVHSEGAYTPYSSKEIRVIFPGQQGGPNYGGVSVDPDLGYVFVNSRNVAGMGRLDKTPDGDQVAYRRFSPLGRGSFYSRFWDPAKQLPCQQPPWAELMAVNANTGDIAWRIPLGTSDELEAKGVHNTGAFGQGGPISTAGGLVFIAGTIDKRFRAFDSRTGKMLWETKLDAEGHTNPMTYLGRNGKQYVVIVSSGINAFALE
ncbi:MAG TPA: PQQ-binding-like beta-propeller repeat protein [Bryobacteraceae bacterium]|nr:PQQ-binding-like beta-propeller repeat protein [Bryobacteraceae bacterium]